MGKTARAVISGSRLFNTVFGLPRNGENITRSLGPFQSGSPPGQDFGELSRVATIDCRGTEDPFFNPAAAHRRQLKRRSSSWRARTTQNGGALHSASSDLSDVDATDRLLVWRLIRCDAPGLNARSTRWG